VLAVITTHYDSLKALGESDPRFANAGMEYDLERLRPTFRLAVGAPGRAYAFDIAARMGLPASLLERARALAGDSSVGLESAIARLAAREAGLAIEAERLAEAGASASATAEAQREAALALVRRERELGHRAREAVESAIAEARAEIRQIVRRAQEAGTSRAAEAGAAASRPSRASPHRGSGERLSGELAQSGAPLDGDGASAARATPPISDRALVITMRPRGLIRRAPDRRRRSGARRRAIAGGCATPS